MDGEELELWMSLLEGKVAAGDAELRLNFGTAGMVVLVPASFVSLKIVKN